MRHLPFWKVQATGNDFILLDFRQAWPSALGGLAELSALAPSWCHRHAGVGADGILVVGPGGAEATARMDVVNADGSLPEMCGNGLRAVATWLAGPGGEAKGLGLRIATPAGLKDATWLQEGPGAGQWQVNLGPPELRRGKVPFTQGAADEAALDEPLGFGSETVLVSAISMGNPHAVIVVPSVEELPMADWGPRLAQHPAFPRGANVGFLEVVDSHHARLRVWERGAGATQACGTGTAAALVAGHLTGRLASAASLQLPGGCLQASWGGPGHGVLLSGEAHVVFEGSMPFPAGSPLSAGDQAQEGPSSALG